MRLRIRVEIFANPPGKVVGEDEFEIEGDLPRLESLDYERAFSIVKNRALQQAWDHQAQEAREATKGDDIPF